MARDILGEYGPESAQPQRPSANNGGRLEPKPIEYHPPVGPSNINDPKSAGIHGTNLGPCGTQGKR
jgi:hypothetical protein